jgi:hypothetical protein
MQWPDVGIARRVYCTLRRNLPRGGGAAIGVQDGCAHIGRNTAEPDAGNSVMLDIARGSGREPSPLVPSTLGGSQMDTRFARLLQMRRAISIGGDILRRGGAGAAMADALRILEQLEGN